jgi:hypothetical protein
MSDKKYPRKELPIESIRIDGDTQQRELSEEHIEQMTGKIDELPPAIVFRDGKDFWLADGFHRYHAHRRAKKRMMPCIVHVGTQRDAWIYSLSANHDNGVPRTMTVRRHVVTLCLKDPELAKLSDRRIAEICAVSHPFVGTIRRDLTGNGYQSTERTGRDGRTIDTANIGKKATPVENFDPAEDFNDPSAGDEQDDPTPPTPPAARLSASPPIVQEPSDPWAAFVGEVQQLQSSLRGLSLKLGSLLDFDPTTKRPRNKFAHFMSRDGTVDAINAVVRYLSDYSPAEAAEKPPGFIPAHSVETRNRHKKAG